MKNLSDLCSDYKNTPAVYREPIELILRLAVFELFELVSQTEIIWGISHGRKHDLFYLQ